jgi:hypothetical protein
LLLIPNNLVKKAKSQEEKKALNQKNRRVTFKILSWDFPVSKKDSASSKEKED